MGMRFRKSINLGFGFRINVSKSGVGYSWGVPGYRKTASANGKKYTTYSIPKTGISYVNRKNKQKSHSGNYDFTPTPQEEMQNIESADINNFQPAEYSDFIKCISKVFMINRIATFLIIVGIFFPIFPLIFPVFLLLIILLILGVAAKIFTRFFSKYELNYEMDDFSANIYDKRKQLLLSLNSCAGLWQTISFAKVSNTKINAGAERNISRKNVRFSNKVPFYLKSNVQAVSLKLMKEKLYFLPDKILIIKGRKIGAISYDELQFGVEYIDFIESNSVPKDAEIIGYTWQYVNKNGSPDKRYKGNRKLPKCEYGLIKMVSDSGLNVELQCSNLNVFNDFIAKSKSC